MIKGAICAIIAVTVIVLLYKTVQPILINAEIDHYKNISGSSVVIQHTGLTYFNRKILSLPTQITASNGVVITA